MSDNKIRQHAVLSAIGARYLIVQDLHFDDFDSAILLHTYFVLAKVRTPSSDTLKNMEFRCYACENSHCIRQPKNSVSNVCYLRNSDFFKIERFATALSTLMKQVSQSHTYEIC